jgi:Tol biopolymer transport system component
VAVLLALAGLLPAGAAAARPGPCVGPATLVFRDGGLYRVRANGSGFRLLVKDGANPEWSPDGMRIAYDVEESGTATPGNVYVVNADGTGRKQLTRDGRGFLPTWSADGRSIYFVDVNGGGRFAIDIDGNGRGLLTPARFPFSATAWSHDGRRFLALVARRLVVVSRDGTHSRILLAHDVSGAVWSPDDRSIAFSVPNGGVFVIPAEGGAAKRVSVGKAFEPTWSPQGDRLAYEVDEQTRAGIPTGFEIDVVGRGGTRRVRILQHRGGDVAISDLSWSPDGRWLAYDVGPTPSSRPYDVFLVRPNGTGKRNLTGPLPIPRYEAAESPRWRPCRLR